MTSRAGRLGLDSMYTPTYNQSMGRSYSIAEARAKLPSIVDEVGVGPPVEITRRGKPVAVVLSLAQYDSLRQRRSSFSDAYRSFREKFDLEELALDEGFAASLRSRGTGRKVDL